MIFRTYFYST